jgi:hypothetical protein
MYFIVIFFVFVVSLTAASAQDRDMRPYSDRQEVNEARLREAIRTRELAGWRSDYVICPGSKIWLKWGETTQTFRLGNRPECEVGAVYIFGHVKIVWRYPDGWIQTRVFQTMGREFRGTFDSEHYEAVFFIDFFGDNNSHVNFYGPVTSKFDKPFPLFPSGVVKRVSASMRARCEGFRLWYLALRGELF